jgi:hypothetical protein
MFSRTAARRYSLDVVKANTSGDAGSAAWQAFPVVALIAGTVGFFTVLRFKGSHRPVTSALCYHGAADHSNLK